MAQHISETIKFGLHGVDEPPNSEGKNTTSADFPKDVVDEWPAPKQVHSFYFVKYRSYDDPKWKDKIDQAEKELQRKNQQRFQITEALKAKRSDRTRVNEQLRPLFTEMKQYNMVMNEKRNEIKPLQEALGSLRGANNVEREKGAGICSSEEELNNLIQSLHYRMQHESIPLTEEKQLIREIKQLEGTRENVIAYAAMRAKIQDSLGHKEAIQEQVKLIGTNLDGVRKERQAVSSKISYLDSEREDIENNIKALEAELKTVTQKRDEAFETLQQLRKQRDEGNACFYQNRSLLNSARELAAKKDIKTLEELSIAEVDKFMSLWCSSKAFRDDYEKRILPSLDVRQLSKDGRMRNPNEKPLAVMEPLRPTVTESVSEPKPKPPREDLKNTVKQDILPMQMIQKESTEKSVELKTASKHRAIEEETVVVENPEMFIAKDKEIDPTKLKEMKKEEEMAKQRQALERKKKLADKAAAKAAIRAQKEAEKKQMELTNFYIWPLISQLARIYTETDATFISLFPFRSANGN
ncbi:hypothetical protein Nepgr_007482 [Nepenthes gracilis]|uniref:Proton pump-interactor 1 n=1 Tax=Nepenthes gracilis TaxID=150966 RepID=A0AAD3S7W9_NEPGR|nr:hypothetical protein Nepgr_007482 [Nepenthes gracilis]